MRWNIIGNFNKWVPSVREPDKVIRDKDIPLAKALNFIVPNTKPLRKWDWQYGNGGWVELSKKPFDNGHAFIRKLQKKGFKVLGQGHYSSVLAKGDSDRVIKVCHNEDGDAWIDYCLWSAQKGYAGTLAPRVYSYKKIGTFYVAILEKMEYCAYKHDNKKKLFTAPYLFNTAIQGSTEAGELLDIILPGAKKFAQDLYDEYKNGRLDLHNENLMFRADGSICITDPVCHRSTLKVTRLRAKDFGLAQATFH